MNSEIKEIEKFGNRIYKILFEQEVGDEILRKFIASSKILTRDYLESEITELNFYIQKNLDLEALELSSRVFKVNPLLIVHFNLMITIGETVKENRNKIINNEDKIISPFCILAFSLFRTIVKLCKGTLILLFRPPNWATDC